MAKLAFSFLLLPMILAGCSSSSLTTTTITNLTPSQMPRNEGNLYLVEAMFQSNQQSMKKETIKGYVKIGQEFHPMQRTARTSNRYEALVPVPPNEKFLNYRFKFEYDYNAIPIVRSDSKLSPPFQLEIYE